MRDRPELSLRMLPAGDRVGKCALCANHLEGRTIALCVRLRGVEQALCPDCAHKRVEGLRWLLEFASEAAACFPRLPADESLERVRDLLASVADEEVMATADGLLH